MNQTQYDLDKRINDIKEEINEFTKFKKEILELKHKAINKHYHHIVDKMPDDWYMLDDDMYKTLRLLKKLKKKIPNLMNAYEFHRGFYLVVTLDEKNQLNVSFKFLNVEHLYPDCVCTIMDKEKHEGWSNEYICNLYSHYAGQQMYSNYLDDIFYAIRNDSNEDSNERVEHLIKLIDWISDENSLIQKSMKREIDCMVENWKVFYKSEMA